MAWDVASWDVSGILPSVSQLRAESAARTQTEEAMTPLPAPPPALSEPPRSLHEETTDQPAAESGQRLQALIAQLEVMPSLDPRSAPTPPRGVGAGGRWTPPTPTLTRLDAVLRDLDALGQGPYRTEEGLVERERRGGYSHMHSEASLCPTHWRHGERGVESERREGNAGDEATFSMPTAAAGPTRRAEGLVGRHSVSTGVVELDLDAIDAILGMIRQGTRLSPRVYRSPGPRG